MKIANIQMYCLKGWIAQIVERLHLNPNILDSNPHLATLRIWNRLMQLIIQSRFLSYWLGLLLQQWVISRVKLTCLMTVWTHLIFPIGGWTIQPLANSALQCIVGADIEGTKSDIAMNAWPPQASYLDGIANKMEGDHLKI